MAYLPPTTTNKSLITGYELALESSTFGHLAGDTWVQQLSIAGCSTSVWLQTLAGLDENMAPDAFSLSIVSFLPDHRNSRVKVTERAAFQLAKGRMAAQPRHCGVP